jgi:ankyrin repeat protein
MSGHFAIAIESGDSATIQRLLDDGYDINAPLPRWLDPPPLLHAVQHKQLAIAKLLLRHGANIDGADTFGTTSCHAVARLPFADQREYFEILLSYQPNLGLQTQNGFTVLQSVLPASNFATLLIKAGAPLQDTDLLAFSISSTDTIQALLDRGVVINQLTSHYGFTPLHKAATLTRNTAVLDMLLNVCDVDIEARDMRGNSCIFTAVEYGNSAVLLWAVCVGADVNCRNLQGSTLLYKACLATVCGCDAQSVIYTLLAGGADLDAPEKHGETPRQLFTRFDFEIDEEALSRSRRRIVKTRLDYVRRRASQVCIGLQSLQLPALQMCEILLFSCDPIAPLIPFHQWWKIATTAKHF